jgi:hypothetical protein
MGSANMEVVVVLEKQWPPRGVNLRGGRLRLNGKIFAGNGDLTVLCGLLLLVLFAFLLVYKKKSSDQGRIHANNRI